MPDHLRGDAPEEIRPILGVVGRQPVLCGGGRGAVLGLFGGELLVFRKDGSCGFGSFGRRCWSSLQLGGGALLPLRILHGGIDERWSFDTAASDRSSGSKIVSGLGRSVAFCH